MLPGVLLLPRVAPVAYGSLSLRSAIGCVHGVATRGPPISAGRPEDALARLGQCPLQGGAGKFVMAPM